MENTATNEKDVTKGQQEKPRKAYKCDYEGCKSTFQRPNKLAAHTVKHTGERPFECEKCDKTYTNESHLRRHKKTVHTKIDSNKSESLRCPHEGCHRYLANKESYVKHINRFHNIKNRFEYNCEICNEGFWKKHQLNVHMYYHTGKIPFTCDACQIGFTSKVVFTKHNRNHKTYKCDCGEVFTRWTVILKHKKTCKVCIKTKKKIYKCEDCEKTFLYKYSLKTHRESTHEDLPFRCSFENCNRAYSYKKNLKFHIEHYHLNQKGKTLKCTYPGCDRVLSKQQNLNIHLIKVHKQRIKVKKPRKPRKDKGTFKRSTGLTLAGLTVPYEIEKKLINGENIDLDFEDIIETKHSKSDNDVVSISSDTSEETSDLEEANNSVPNNDSPISNKIIEKQSNQETLLYNTENMKLTDNLLESNGKDEDLNSTKPELNKWNSTLEYDSDNSQDMKLYIDLSDIDEENIISIQHFLKQTENKDNNSKSDFISNKTYITSS